MRNINEFLVKKLSYEERLCFYRMPDIRQLSKNELEGTMNNIQILTEINLLDNDFNGGNIAYFGIDNCCNFFKAVCEQYHDAYTKGFDECYDKRMPINIWYEKPEIVDIGLYNCAEEIDKIVKENYEELLNGSMKGNSKQKVAKYALLSTFSNAYYSIRDFVEGKSYKDNQIMNTYRVLPDEYEQQSKNIINNFMERTNIRSVEHVKEEIIDTLNQGMMLINNIEMNIVDEQTNTRYV